MTSVLLDPYDPTKGIVGNATEAAWGIHVGSAVLGNIHPADTCLGQDCVIHSPSNHHMRRWPLTWRGDKKCFERTCPHGVGHPDPDDAAFQHAIGRPELTVHGCDGCCSKGF